MSPSPTALQSKANPQQLEAILATDGPVLIIAGPGSGKTFTLVERIVYLITHKGVTPESLLVVTFTDKAARELTTRISNRLAELDIQFNLNEMYLGTFHSICLRLLEDYREFTRLKRSFTLFDQFDQQYFLYQHIKDFRALPDAELVMGDDQTGRWAQSENLLKWLNKVGEEALDATALAAAPEPEIRALANCFAKYQELLHEHNSLDFSGIQYEALQLLEKRPEVLGQLRDKLTHLMVDEYQDTNTIQERILLLLAGERRNLCVVGDDDQGLYRFRGATIRNILEFPALFDDGQCKQVKLTVNYRSHPDIIRFYNEWMKEQVWDDGTRVFRFAKQIVPREDDFPDLPTAVRLAASDDKDDTTNWHAEVLAFLNGLKSSGQLADWNQVAFLFRSVKNDKVVALARFLETQGVPVFSPRSNMFFEREEIRLAIGALIFLFPQFPKVRAWAEGVTLPIWDFYDHQCFKPFIDELRKPENKPLLDWARPLAKRHAVLTQNTDYAFSGLFYQLLQFPLFSRFLTEEAVQGVDKGRAARNLGTFSKLLTKFEYLHFVSVLNPEWLEKNLRDLFNQFLRFLQDGGIGEYEDEAEYAPKGCVSFLTIHQSKGLEFPVVVCGSLEAVPRKQYGALDVLLEDGGYLSKERFEPLDRIKNFDFWRLFYTAFSRAQNLLVLAAQEKQGRGKSPSKYFERLFYELPRWRDVDLSALTFEAVKQINLKREYSFTSHITVFENCAEQYRFFKELEFAPIRESPMLFGTLVHQTIEDIHKTVLRGEEGSITFDAIKGWFSTNYAMLSKKERVYLAPSSQQAALLHVLRYFERENGNWDRIKEAEVEISLIKEQYILKGSVDLIRGEHDTVEIIDFKSEKKPDMEKDRDRLRQYQHQLEVYAHLVEERTGQKVSRMHLYYTGEDGGNPYVSFTKDDRAIGKTIARFDDIVARIERQDYQIATRPAKLCLSMRHASLLRQQELEIQEKRLMSKNTPAQESLQLATPDGVTTNVEKYEFEPIKGYPMLNWRGKRPFTSTQYYPAQLKEVHGEEVDGWRNKIFWGDNLQVMSHLLKEFRGKVDLIYIDPPFDSKADYKKKISLRSKEVSSDQTTFEEKQYTDIWSNDDYLQFMYERLILLRELLSETGSIYVHCDYHQNHYLRCVLDEVFGRENFLNEIVWKRAETVKGNSGQGSKYFGENTDTIFFYRRGGDHRFTPQFKPYTQEYIDAFYKYFEPETNRQYRLISMTAPGGDGKGNPFYDVMGVSRHWRYSKERMNDLIANSPMQNPEKPRPPQPSPFVFS